jgi:hypothetical protein
MHDIRLATIADVAIIARQRARMFEDMEMLPPDQVPILVEQTIRYLEGQSLKANTPAGSPSRATADGIAGRLVPGCGHRADRPSRLSIRALAL